LNISETTQDKSHGYYRTSIGSHMRSSHGDISNDLDGPPFPLRELLVPEPVNSLTTAFLFLSFNLQSPIHLCILTWVLSNLSHAPSSLPKSHFHVSDSSSHNWHILYLL